MATLGPIPLQSHSNPTRTCSTKLPLLLLLLWFAGEAVHYQVIEEGLRMMLLLVLSLFLLIFLLMFAGEEVDYHVIEEGVRMICQDIKKERARIGGDWAVSCVLHTKKMREIVREELGKELLVICLNMEMEEQMDRIRSRHLGDEKVVERMKTVYNLCEQASSDESNTCEVKIDARKNPDDVLKMVLQKINAK